MQPIPRLVLLAAAATADWSLAARAQAPASDAALEQLVADTQAHNPELAQARGAVNAEAQRIPQAGALPDPVLSLGIQNDGFNRIAIGSAETSYLSIMGTQAFPFPGKRGLREQVASLEKQRAEARLARVALSLEGQVRRAYLDYLLARDQLALLGELQSFWQQAEAAARARYESGQAPQSDLLRAQLERARLEQRRWVLEAEVANRLAAINRLRVRPLEEPLATQARIGGTADPVAPPLEIAAGDAESRSPELKLAQLGVDQAGRRSDLARKDLFPDFSVSAAVMPRGSLEPMWQIGFNVSLPIWAYRKQLKAIEESQARRAAEAQGEEAIRQILRLRVRERMALLDALVRSNKHYRDALLPLSDATTRSTLAQYEVGRLPFAAVLEALGSYVANRGSYLESIAQAQRMAIAQREVSLEPLAAAAGGMAAASVPGAGAQGRGMGGGTGSSQGEAASDRAVQSGSGM
jgi:cobalt-zinc-cadmium efflux system outer membrane protein